MLRSRFALLLDATPSDQLLGKEQETHTVGMIHAASIEEIASLIDRMLADRTFRLRKWGDSSKKTRVLTYRKNFIAKFCESLMLHQVSVFHASSNEAQIEQIGEKVASQLGAFHIGAGRKRRVRFRILDPNITLEKRPNGSTVLGMNLSEEIEIEWRRAAVILWMAEMVRHIYASVREKASKLAGPPVCDIYIDSFAGDSGSNRNSEKLFKTVLELNGRQGLTHLARTGAKDTHFDLLADSVAGMLHQGSNDLDSAAHLELVQRFHRAPLLEQRFLMLKRK